MARARIKVPRTLKAGEPFQVKALISHKMESGQREDTRTGEKIPRFIINRLVARIDGDVVFAADWHPSVSANPYIAFYTTIEKDGTLELTWTDDAGESVVQAAELKLS